MTGDLEVAGRYMASRDEGGGGRRVGGRLEKGGDVPGGLDDVFAGQVGPLCNEVWDIQPPRFGFGGSLAPIGERCRTVTTNHDETLVGKLLLDRRVPITQALNGKHV